MFIEIVKQSDSLNLSISVALIDELSNGIAILSTSERIKLEILYFLLKFMKREDSLYPPNIFVWTKLAYTLGFMRPTSTAFSPEDMLAIQKAFIDQMWSISLKQMIDIIGMEAILNMPQLNNISEKLNEGKMKYAHENRSFKQIFLSEIAGYIDICKPELEDALIYLYEKEAGKRPTKTELNSSKAGQQFANLIYQAFKQNKIETDLPTISIGAGLHASLRLDLKRQFKKNDMHDFGHAQTALPYFDYFFTEHSLRDLVKRKNIAFDQKFNCEVVSHLQEAFDCIDKICR